MTQEQVAELLQKYLDGVATLQETALLESWYDTLDAGTLPSPRKQQIATQMHARIRKAIHQQEPKATSVIYTVLKIAAMLLICSGAGMIWWQSSRKTVDPSAIEYVSTGLSERKKLLLADGTEIIMYPNTKIAYPKKFSAIKRVVKLTKGEAFFDVAHEEKRSFAVTLNSGLAVKVLGTSFKIQDIADDHLLKVSVATGKVAVSCGLKTAAELTRGQELQYHKNSGRLSITRNLKPVLVKIPFNGTTLKEVAKRLAYLYSIRIDIKDPKLLALKCTATFNSGQRVSEILDILCKLHHLRLSESADHQTFKIFK